MGADPYFRPRRSAQFLSLSPSTLPPWRSRDRGPRYTKTRRGEVLYRLSWLDEFMVDGDGVSPGAVDPCLLGRVQVTAAYVRVEAAADYLRRRGYPVAVETLRAWRDRGQGPLYYQPTRGIVRYRLPDLARWLAWTRGELVIDEQREVA